jgi:hypothetical protein
LTSIGIPISLQEFAEMTHNFRVGEELGPVRSGCRGLGFSHLIGGLDLAEFSTVLRVKQVRNLDKMTVV